MSIRQCDFRLKSINEDFIVNEVPLLPDFESMPQKYTYVWLKKSNYTTFEALEAIKDFYGLDFSDVVAEGLKDEDGITSQIVSINRKLAKKSIAEFNKAYAGEEAFIFIERIMGYGAEPVVAKALHGNMFCVTIRNLSAEEAEKIVEYTKKHKIFPFINYYDTQRFGLPGGPYTTHLIGEAICKNRWNEAFELLKDSGNEIPAGKTGKAAFEAMNPSRVGFFVSSYNSSLWNKAASEYLGTVIKTQAFDFPHLGELNTPLTPELVPISEFTIEGRRFDPETFSVVDHEFKRNLAYPTVVYAGVPQEDEIYPGKTCVKLSFFLSTGCYATMMIRQIVATALKEENND